MPYGWKGNRSSGVALVMRNEQVVYPLLGSRPKEEMNTPPAVLHAIAM